MPETERMAVELTVVVEVPADITEEQMDAEAEKVRAAVADGYDVGSSDVQVETPYLLPRPLSDAEKRAFIDEDSRFVDTQDAASRYQDTEVDA